MVLKDSNFVRNLTRACLTEKKWVDSILIHFFAGLRRYGIVKPFFHWNAQTSTKKKKVSPFFSLIQHTSAVLYAEFRITALILVMYRGKYGRYVRIWYRNYTLWGLINDRI